MFFDFMCPIIPFLNTVAINLNTLTMIVSSVDRLIQIICPLRTKLRKKKFSFIILVIWIFSILLSLPWNFLIKVEEKNSITGDIEQENIDYESSSNDESIKLCVPQFS
jgi:neuropeptide Y receptor